MCGVPHHSVAGSINKLLQNGFKVAICDQIEDPKLAKGLVKRAVTRILSPGVVYDPDTLDSLKANYLASFDDQSISFLDTTTGEAFYFLIKNLERRLRLLLSLQPVEVVISTKARLKLQAFLDSHREFQPLITIHDEVSDNKSDQTELELIQALTIAAIGIDSLSETSLSAKKWPQSSWRLLSYGRHMQGAQLLSTIQPFEQRELVDRMELPPTVIRHLEIFETYKGDSSGSLFQAIHRTKTSSGARLLRQWLQFPLANQSAIEQRFERVQHWFDRHDDLKALRQALGGLGDIQRRLGKIGNPSCHPRDLISLSESLRAGLEVSRLAIDCIWNPQQLQAAERLASQIERTLVEEPPLQLKNGGMIRKGVHPQLDEWIELSTNSHDLIMKLESRERTLTGISSLKIRFNNVFGYYIEITHTHKDKVPKERYERKQTLANAERYLTPELAELELKVLSAQSKRLELERAIFDELIQTSLREAQALLALASQWAECDVLSSFAWLALEENFVRPQLSERGHLCLIGSRHPVIEQTLKLPFIANDVMLNRSGCLLLTGPNMAGKSTLMRQVAISSLLAQVGSFVPAREARLPIFDRIFTRIGASDHLSEGLSTFMVEMKETAEMLSNATEDSLVILDEVGRGTSTYDGMSLAQAILEFLLETSHSMTLFATHYHELTALADRFPQAQNGHMAIFEKGNDITFLHQLVHGPANKSYGIHVGRLAGLPASVTRRAAYLLKRLELGAESPQLSLLGMALEPVEPVNASAHHVTEQDASAHLATEQDMGEQKIHSEIESYKAELALASEMRELDLTRLTPLEALNQISKWQQSLS